MGFLHVDDLTDSLLFLMNIYSDYDHVNVGTGKDITIKNLSELIKNIVGFKGNIKWDTSKPDGTPRKLPDITKLNTQGWKQKISLFSGIKKGYEYYKTRGKK